MATITRRSWRLKHRLSDSFDELRAERVESVLDHLSQPLTRCTFIDLAHAVLKTKNRSLSDDLLDNVRTAFSTTEGTDTLHGLVNTSIARGHDGQNDTTVGWTARQSLPNFLEAQFAHLDRTPRLEQVARGDTAEHIAFRMQTESGFSLARFGAQFVLDEQDLMDERSIGLQLIALEETGRAATRLIGDLVYAKILANPTMEHDSTAVFHADHSNYGSAVLSSAALAAGASAIAAQVLADEDGLPAHLNLEAAYLLIPPALSYNALENARAREVEEKTLTVRADSRLSATGSYDPTNSTLYAGSDTNWLMAAPASQRPCVIVAARDGNFTPRVRPFALTGGGQWGIGFDIAFDVAVAIIDYRGLYFSTGTA